jgi:cytochrome c-type biogenesis protein CcmH/NrfF
VTGRIVDIALWVIPIAMIMAAIIWTWRTARQVRRLVDAPLENARTAVEDEEC